MSPHPLRSSPSRSLSRRAALQASAVAGTAVLLGWRPAHGQSARVRVVTSFSILADLVQNVGGDRVEVRSLVGPDGDTHTFEPTPGDARALAGADLVFEIGLNFETWLNDLARSSRARGRRVALGPGVSPLRAADRGHRHGEFDPHIWHDIARVVLVVEQIRDALSAHDPAGRDSYWLNAGVYNAYLRDLDSWAVNQALSLPAERRKLVTSHYSFAYLADRYGFELLGAAISSFSTDAEPSARELAALVSDVRAAGVPAIFPENIANPRLMERIARDAGVRLAPPLYSDALGRAGGPADSYYNLMTANITTIVTALGS